MESGPNIISSRPGNDNDNNTMVLDQFLNSDIFINRSSMSDGLGIPLSNRFACLLNAPRLIDAQNGWLEFQVLSVDCPGIAIETNAIELNGVQRYNFKGRSYDDLQITFLETSELTLRDFFFHWMEKAVRINQTGGFERNYLENVVASNFAVAPLDYQGVARRVDRFTNVFPIRVLDLNYNYGTAGEIIKTTVTFKYMYHRVETIDMSADSEHLSTRI